MRSSLGLGEGARGPVGAGSGAAGQGAGTAGEGAARGPRAPGEEGSDLTGRARELPRRRREVGERSGRCAGPAAGAGCWGAGRARRGPAVAAAVGPPRRPASRRMLVSQPDRWAGKEFEAFALFKLPVDSP